LITGAGALMGATIAAFGFTFIAFSDSFPPLRCGASIYYTESYKGLKIPSLLINDFLTALVTLVFLKTMVSGLTTDFGISCYYWRKMPSISLPFETTSF
jgi:hypothetical protein